MSTVRNWLKTLWPASFNGVSFFFEQDDESGGRGVVTHVFVNRDDPYNEDLGENPRHYSGHAYVTGDNADDQALSLIAALVTAGPGNLVVPLFGPVLCRALSFKRKHARDKLGYVAFEVKFVREGAATALISIGSLANAAYGAVDSLVAVTAESFASSLIVLNQPDFVVAAAADGVAIAAAAFDNARTSNAVDPAVSATVRDDLSSIVSEAPAVIVNSEIPSAPVVALATSLITDARSLSDAMPPAAAVTSMLAIVDSFPAPSSIASPPSAAAAALNAAAAARLTRLAALTAYADAVIARTYIARPDGVTARAQVSVRLQTELDQCHGAADAALYVAIQSLRARVIDYLTQLINNLVPVVTVETAIILPSLYLAWRLYADPLRSTELVERNRVRHPSFMPTEFEALAS
jgi:prophage DNA circulation protein